MRQLPENKEVQVFFDGDCPLCMREVNMLRRLDRRDAIEFTDIAATTFDATEYDKSQSELMDQIHGRDENGEWIVGVEVFRQLYAAVGLGWLVAITRVPGIRQLADWCYSVFAKNRLAITGRSSGKSCETQQCAISES